MNLKSILSGGMMAGRRAYIIAATRIVAAAGSYLAGDADLLSTLQALLPLAAVYFLQKGISDGK